MEWFENFATANPVAYSILLLSLVAVVGLGFASIKIRGIGLGVTGVLFAGLIFGHFGFHLEHHTLEFLREFGLILFVFTIGLQIGPGFCGFAEGSGTGAERPCGGDCDRGRNSHGNFRRNLRNRFWRGGGSVLRSNDQYTLAGRRPANLDWDECG